MIDPLFLFFALLWFFVSQQHFFPISYVRCIHNLNPVQNASHCGFRATVVSNSFSPKKRIHSLYVKSKTKCLCVSKKRIVIGDCPHISLHDVSTTVSPNKILNFIIFWRKNYFSSFTYYFSTRIPISFPATSNNLS